MKKVNLVIIVLSFTRAVCQCAAAQADPPGNIRLLPGYEHQTLQGIDTQVGRIWKESGLLIHYDIGQVAGNFATAFRPDQRLWHKEQASETHRGQLTLTKDRMLCVTFPDDVANFYAAVKTEEDIVDMLLMVLNYSRAQRAR